MKKYVKPELYYESFEVTTHVAACDYDHRGTFHSTENCGFTYDYDDSIVLFTQGNGFCKSTPSDLGLGPLDCYYPGSDDASLILNLFNS